MTVKAAAKTLVPDQTLPPRDGGWSWDEHFTLAT